MAVGDGDDVLTYTRTWFDLEGCTHLMMAHLRCLQVLKGVLPKHMLKSSSDKETFRRTVHDQVFQNEDAQ